ncbi:hypothetical protein EDB83DRAFT_214834 [Lactarius deliciosus]|nr:hypothetical protein EDB83DRAFT_214834 [Lactarius deliciosus]
MSQLTIRDSRSPPQSCCHRTPTLATAFPTMDTGALSELIKAKVTSLIQEHLKPIVNELAAQHRMLQTHSALLKYNHNVNDYQMTRLENLRDLEQSINFKVAGALGFDPWQHPTMGTNLREPVPADPRLIPRFTPENATPTQRASESAELIAQAGVSARRLGVPLTLQDFPRDPAIHSGGENEDPMHSAVPLFGIRAPRWRAKEGLPPDVAPGLATYNGVAAPPAGKKGKKLYAKRAQKLNPKWKTFEAATAPTGPSSSSSTLDRLFDLLDGPALAGPSGSSGKVATGGTASTSGVPHTPESLGRAPVEMSRSSSSSTSLASPNPFAPEPLASTPTTAPLPSPALPPAPPAPTIFTPVPRPTFISTATTIVLGGATPTPSLIVKPPVASTSTTTSDITIAPSGRSQSDSQRNDQTRFATAPSFISTPTVPTPPSLKRTRRAAELEDDNGGGSSSSHRPVPMVVPPTRTSPEPQQIKQEGPESGTGLEPGPQRKRRRRSAAPSPSPSIGLGDGWPGPGHLRRSTRVARAHACTTATATIRPAPRRRNTTGNGKRATTKS